MKKQAPVRNIQKIKHQRLLSTPKGQIFLQRKGLNLDLMLISQVVVVYSVVNEFTDSDKKTIFIIYLLHSNDYFPDYERIFFGFVW